MTFHLVSNVKDRPILAETARKMYVDSYIRVLIPAEIPHLWDIFYCICPVFWFVIMCLEFLQEIILSSVTLQIKRRKSKGSSIHAHASIAIR